MYAIDFGTSNTVITRWNAATQAAETVSLPGLSSQSQGNPPLIPSLVYVENAENASVTVGQTVRDRALDLTTDPRFFRNIKRGIGTAVQGFIPELDGQILSFEQVGSYFLHQVIGALKAQEPELNSLVFTVPVDSFEAYRIWLSEVCESLNIEQVQLIDEPTAAALGYQLSPEQRTVLVIDFGGGTLDLSLIQRAASAIEKPRGLRLQWGKAREQKPANQARVKTVKVIAKAGENLGGADIDRWLADYFELEQGLPKTAVTLRLVEKLKIALSSSAEATEAYFDEDTLDSYELSLGRDRLNQILTEKGFFDRLENRLEQVLQQASRQSVSRSDIDAILLVGGSAQIPAIHTWAESHFDPDKIKRDRPFEAVAQGALRLENTELKDFLYHSYGIRYWDRRTNTHSWHPIVPEGQPYPTDQPIELFLGASSEQQPSIELILGELSSPKTSTEVYFEGNQLVTRQTGTQADSKAQAQPLNDRDGARTIATLTPLGFPGSDRIRVLFNIDAQRFLRMTVDDLLTTETLMSEEIVVQLQ
ncbi:MAG: Hsp70 family protein [Phormidesmis sp.]